MLVRDIFWDRNVVEEESSMLLNVCTKIGFENEFLEKKKKSIPYVPFPDVILTIFC